MDKTGKDAASTIRRNCGRLAIIVLLLPAWIGLRAQQAPPQTPTFRSGVELVTVDVGVIDRQGQPLRGLAAGDFTVTVAGQPRKVVSAEYVDSLAETSRSNLRRSSLDSMISSNEGASI